MQHAVKHQNRHLCVVLSLSFLLSLSHLYTELQQMNNCIRAMNMKAKRAKCASQTQPNERMSNDKKTTNKNNNNEKTGIRNERLIGFVLRRQRRYLCLNIHSNRHVVYTCECVRGACDCAHRDALVSVSVYVSFCLCLSFCESLYRSVDTIRRKIISGVSSTLLLTVPRHFHCAYKVYDVLKHHCIGTEASYPAISVQFQSKCVFVYIFFCSARLES